MLTSDLSRCFRRDELAEGSLRVMRDNEKDARRFRAHYDPNGEDAIQRRSSGRTREILGLDEIADSLLFS